MSLMTTPATEVKSFEVFSTLDVNHGCYIFAERMYHDYPDWDWCAGAAVIDIESMEVVAENATIDKTNPDDVRNLDIANRIVDSFQSQDNDYRDTATYLPFSEMANLIASRANAKLYWLNDERYGVSASEFPGYDPRYVLVGDHGESLAKEYASMCNGNRWSVFSVPFHKVAQWIKFESELYGSEFPYGIDWAEFDYQGLATDDCHGYTWANIDSCGYSEPTVYELLTAL